MTVCHTSIMAAQLEQIAYHYPDAKVVGHVAGMPIIRLDEHNLVRLWADGSLTPTRPA